MDVGKLFEMIIYNKLLLLAGKEGTAQIGSLDSER